MKRIYTIPAAFFLTAALLSSCHDVPFFPSVTKYFKTLSLVDELEDFSCEEACAGEDGILYLVKGSVLYTWSESSGLVSYLVFESPINAMDIDTETSQLYVLIDILWEVDLADGTKTMIDENCSDCVDLCVAGDYIVIANASEWTDSSCRTVRRSDYAVTDSFTMEIPPVGLTFSDSDSRLFIQMAWVYEEHRVVDLDQATGLFGTVHTVPNGNSIRAVFPDGTKIVTSDGSIVSADENWDYLGSVNDAGATWDYNLRAACVFNDFLVVFVTGSGTDSEQDGMTVYPTEVPFDPVKPTMGIESTGTDLLVSGDYMYLLARPPDDYYSLTEIYRFDSTICDP